MKQKSRSARFPLPLILLVIGIAIGGLVTFYRTPYAQPSVLGTATPTTNPGIKEVFVSMGFGIGNNISDWTDIPGMQVSIDASKYGSIKEVRLEVTPFVPTGNQTIWVRVRNSDYYSYGEVTMDGSGPKMLTSATFPIGGNKTYYLQLKTQLSYPVHIYQARLHIFTN